jgi:integrase
MAHKRSKGAGWEFIVQRAGLLEKPLYLNFSDEKEGEEYCRRLEALLDKGIVPTEYQVKERNITAGVLIRKYLTEHAGVKQNDKEILNALLEPIGATPMVKMDVDWVDAWITKMKRERRLKPGTILSKVGALARCCDWGIRKKLIVMPDMPLRTLPTGFAAYSDTDVALAGVKKEDVARERRLEHGEEDAIRKVLAAGVLERKQRPLTLEHPKALVTLFDLALETAMRLREMYTLTVDQIHIDRRMIWLDRTKNGDSRQVPLSSVATRIMREYLETEKPENIVFPWWNGERTPYRLRRTTDFLSYRWGDIFEAAGCPDLRFHDLRHEGVSRFFEKTNLSVEEIMKISGHRTHQMVMRYLRLRNSSLADRLW